MPFPEAGIAFGLFAPPASASGLPALLDPLESTHPPAGPPCGCQYDNDPIGQNIPFRHAGWQRDRLLVYDALLAAACSCTRVSAFERCGRSYWVLRNRDDPNIYRTVPETCHDRFCKPCGADRAARIRRNLHTNLGNEPHRFLTLTIRSEDRPLADSLDHLLTSFRTLRKTKLWRRRVTAGAAFFELTYNSVTGLWHPHLHLIIAGKYLPKDRLTTAWKRITGGSFQLKIRFIKDRDETIGYVAKYATKPLHPSVLQNPAALQEAVVAMIGRKTLYCFGGWAKWKLLEDPDADSWIVFAPAAELRDKAADGDDLCQRILAAIVAHPGEEVRVPRAPPITDDSLDFLQTG